MDSRLERGQPCPRSGVWTFCRDKTVRNAIGVLKQSPRLAHSAYLGSRVRTICQPQRGCVPSPRSTSFGRNQMTNNDRHGRECSHNPVGVAVVLARQPNVVPRSRDNVGLWDGAPLGLMNVQTPRARKSPGAGEAQPKLLERTQWVANPTRKRLATPGSESCVVVRNGGTKRRQ